MFTEQWDQSTWPLCSINTRAISCAVLYRSSLVLLQCPLSELNLTFLPVCIQIHWGMGPFCFCFLVRNCLTLNILWEDMARDSEPHTPWGQSEGERWFEFWRKIPSVPVIKTKEGCNYYKVCTRLGKEWCFPMALATRHHRTWSSTCPLGQWQLISPIWPLIYLM